MKFFGMRAALLLAVAVGWLGAGTPAAAQQGGGRVQGEVRVAGTGRPLVGAQVFIPGTNIGTVTNNAGRFLLLNVPAGEATVRVEMLGFGGSQQAVTVAEGQVAAVDFELKETALELNELVVTATGETRKREIGNSVAAINSGEIERAAARSPQDLLGGRATGAVVMANSGQPGAGGTIRLRGNNSVSQGNNPIIYVDGIRIYNGSTPTNPASRQASMPLNDIDPNDIERIEVVKGPAATTLYGTEASGGVIQIFTKRGRTGGAQWSAEVTGGFNNMGHVGPKADPTGLFVNQCRGPNLVTGDGVRFEDPTCPESGSWLSNGPIQRYSLSVRGGGEELTYFLSGNYGDEKGVIRPGGSENGGFRGNFSFRPRKGLEFALSSSYNIRDTRWIHDGNNGNGFLLNVSRGPDSNFKGTGCSDPDVVCVNNAELLKSIANTKTDHFITGFTINYTPTGNFNNRLNIGYDFTEAQITSINPFGFLRVPLGDMSWQKWGRRLVSVDLASSYRHQFGSDVASTSSWGFQMFDSRRESTTATSADFSGPGEPTLMTGARRTVDDDSRERVINAGFFLQEMVGWRDRLFVTAGLRVDGNSAFGESFGLQPYPKVSASYVLSDHDFWPADRIESFKIRGAMGESGKAPGAFDAVRTWSPIAGDNARPGFTPDQLGNPELGPERTREVELGFEASAFEGRIGVDFTYYRQNTYDALIQVRYPPSAGFLNRQLENVGHLRNAGIEMRLEAGLVRNENVDWRARLNLSTVDSKAIDLGGEVVTIASLSRTYVMEGFPVPAYFGKKLANPDEFAAPVVLDDSLYYLGSAYATRTIAPSTSLTLWNRLTIDALGEWQLGGHLLNALGYQNANKGEWYPCIAVQEKMRAFQGGDTGALDDVTALERARCAQGTGVRDYDWWVEKADFFKLRSVSVTYDLPQGLIPGTRSASLTLAGRNLLTVTDYTGTDPEVADVRDGSFSRRDYYNFPTPRTFTASLRVNF